MLLAEKLEDDEVANSLEREVVDHLKLRGICPATIVQRGDVLNQREAARTEGKVKGVAEIASQSTGVMFQAYTLLKMFG